MLFAFRRLVADPVAVVLAVRQGEPSLLDGADLPVLRLLGLDRASAAELLRRQERAAEQELAGRLHRETGGNPLALLELGRERERLADLPPGAPLAAGTSVARVYLSRRGAPPAHPRRPRPRRGPRRRRGVGAGPRGADGRARAADLVPAEAAGLITVRDSRVEFRHPLARSAIYGAAPADQRRAVHRALARALPDTEADRRAWHLALAAFGPDDAASSALEQAASAPASAAPTMSRRGRSSARALLAPDEARQGRLMYDAADAAWLGGLADRAVALLDSSPARVRARSGRRHRAPPRPHRHPPRTGREGSRSSWPPPNEPRRSIRNEPS